ncbi:MAG TPA: membrane protein insertase YidC [Asticcacaulis sp.]
MNKDDNNRNMIFFLIASMVLLAAYQYFVLSPQQKKQQAAQAAAAASSSSAAAAGLPMPGQPVVLTRPQALAQSPRVPIDTPSLKGSIALKGALLDDLYLAKYHETVDPKSPLVELLSPAGTAHPYYAEAGYFGQNVPNLPGIGAQWTLVSGDKLAPGKPVTLAYDNGAGLKFQRTYAIDDNYMITVTDSVANTGAQAVQLEPYASVTRVGMPVEVGRSGYVMEGAMATVSKDAADAKAGYHSQSKRYKDLIKDKTPPQGQSMGGWYAVTDKYWMASVIPNQGQLVNYSLSATALPDKTPVFRAGYSDAAVTVAPGATWTSQSHIFAGAKLHDQLNAYQKSLNLPRFGYALDWGHLDWLTIPFYLLLVQLYKWIGNFGFAILALTVVIKIIFYPLAHRSYVAMMKMKHVQQHLAPKLDAIKKRYADDPAKQQEATMKLYQEEKVNPMAGLSGCLPMLLQLPVFICLVKVLEMSIELRHAPFIFWIKDLSAPDPLTIVNLFGLLPFDPAHVPLIGGFLNGPLHIGPVAILYGASMWLSQQMSPTTGMDPNQRMMMAFMPLIMVFFFSQLAIGLMVYYFWNNILTILQQYSIMRRLKVENPVDNFFARLSKKKAA